MAKGSSVPAWPVRTPPSDRAHARDDVVRGHPRGLVDQQHAVHGGLLPAPRARSGDRRGAAVRRRTACSCAAIASRRNAISSSRVERRGEARGATVPTAALGAGDDRDVDVVVGRAQRDFVLALALAAGELAHERRDLRALQRPQLVDDALGVALLGAGRARSPRRSAPPASARRRRSAASGRAPAPAARACPSACPRRGAGRRVRPRPRLRSARPPSGARAGPCSRT